MILTLAPGEGFEDRNGEPRLAPDVFVAPTAVVVGDVELAEGVSIWYGAVLRGDVGTIRIGKHTNVQDLACIHVTGGVSDTLIGADVTIGHTAIIHGATVADRALIGMGSIVLDGAVIGEEAVVAAGAVVPPGMIVPPRTLVRGKSAKVIRELTADERKYGIDGADGYFKLRERHRVAKPTK
jgi:gamma-carbonic anhydrase